MTGKRFLSLWLPVVLYTGFIFWISSSYRPIPGIEVFPQMDKVFHFLEYLGLGFLMVRAVWNSGSLRWPAALAAAFLAAVAIGALDEFYQSFVPMKEMDLLDWAADAAGSTLGLWVYRVFPKIRLGS